MITHLKGTKRKIIAKKLGYSPSKIKTMILSEKHEGLKGWHRHQLLVLHTKIDAFHRVITSTKQEVETWYLIKLLKP